MYKYERQSLSSCWPRNPWLIIQASTYVQAGVGACLIAKRTKKMLAKEFFFCLLWSCKKVIAVT